MGSLRLPSTEASFVYKILQRTWTFALFPIASSATMPSASNLTRSGKVPSSSIPVAKGCVMAHACCTNSITCPSSHRHHQTQHTLPNYAKAIGQFCNWQSGARTCTHAVSFTAVAGPWKFVVQRASATARRMSFGTHLNVSTAAVAALPDPTFPL